MSINLKEQIQLLREHLHNVVKLAQDDLMAEEVLAVSKELDKLLLQYELDKFGKHLKEKD